MFKYCFLAVLVLAALCQAFPKKRGILEDIEQWVEDNPVEAGQLAGKIEEWTGMTMEDIGNMVQDIDQDDWNKFVEDAEKWMEDNEAEMKKIQAEVEAIIGHSLDDFDFDDISLDDIKAFFEGANSVEHNSKRGLKEDITRWARYNPKDAQDLVALIEGWVGMSMEDINQMVQDLSNEDFDKFVKDSEKWMEENQEEMKKMQAEVEAIIGHSLHDFDMEDISLDDIKSLFNVGDKKRGLKEDVDQWVAENPEEAKQLEAMVEEWIGMTMQEIGDMVKDLNQDDLDKFVKEAEKWMKEFEEEVKKMKAEVEAIIGHSLDDFDMADIDIDEIKAAFEGFASGEAPEKRSLPASADVDSTIVDSAVIDSAVVDSAVVDSAAVDSAAVDKFVDFKMPPALKPYKFKSFDFKPFEFKPIALKKFARRQLMKKSLKRAFLKRRS